MSVNEMDSSVLQPHTNGDISTATVIHNEAHDISNDSKENVQSKDELNVKAEPVGKATDIIIEVTSSPELGNASDIQAPVEAMTPSNSEATLVNGDIEAHATDAASSTFVGTGIDAPNVIVKEQGQVPCTSLIENVIPEPKVDSNQQLALAEQEDSTAETAKETSTDMIAVSRFSAPNSTSIAAVDVVPPTIETFQEEVSATTTKPQLEESTNTQSELTELTLTASLNANSESTFSAEQTPSSISQEASPTLAKSDFEPEIVSNAVMPDTIPADTETLSITAASAAEPIIEAETAEPIELGISASLPAAGKSTQAEAATKEIIPAATAGVPTNPPAMKAAETASETSVVEESAKVTQVTSTVEPAIAAVTPEVHETSPLVEPPVATLPFDATVEPGTVITARETEAVKESIVEPSVIVEEVAHSASEVVTGNVAEPFTIAQVAPGGDIVVPETVVKEESVPIDGTIVSSESLQSVDVQIQSVHTSEDPSAPIVTPVAVLVEEASTTGSVLPEVYDQPTEVLSTGPSGDIPLAPTTIQEATIIESAAPDADVHVPAGVPTEVPESIPVKKETMAEEAAAESDVPEGAEPAKEEVAVVDLPVGAMVAPETAPAAAQETEAIKAVEAGTVAEEAVSFTAGTMTESAAEPVTGIEVASSEGPAPETPMKEESVSVSDATISSEPALHVVTKLHTPSDTISEGPSTSTEALVSVADEMVSIAPPAELPEALANDQSTDDMPLTPSAPAIVQEIVDTGSAAVDTDIHRSAEVTKVEEPVTRPIIPEVAELVKEEAPEAATEFVNSNAPEEVSVASAPILIATEDADSSVESGSVNNSYLSGVSQQQDPVIVTAPDNTLSTEATQDLVPTPVVEKPAISAVAGSPARDEGTPSTEEVLSSSSALVRAPVAEDADIPSDVAPVVHQTDTEEATASLRTAPLRDSVAKDADIPSNKALAADHAESFVEQPTPASLSVDRLVENVIVETPTAVVEKPAITVVVESPAHVEGLPHLETVSVSESVAKDADISSNVAPAADPTESIIEQPTPISPLDQSIKNLIVETPTAVVEKPAISVVAESPAHDEGTPSLETDPLRESLAKDADIASDVAPVADSTETQEAAPSLGTAPVREISLDVAPIVDHIESIIEHPTPASLPVEQPVKNVIVESVATAEAEEPAATSTVMLEGRLTTQNDEDNTVVEAPSSNFEHEPPTAKQTRQEVNPSVLSEEIEVIAAASSDQSSALASEALIKTPLVEPMTGSDESLAQSASFAEEIPMPVADDKSVGTRGTDGTEQSSEAIDQGPILSQQADTEQQEGVTTVEKVPITSATVISAVEPTSDPETSAFNDNHFITEQIEEVSAIEETKALSTKEAAVAEHLQAVPAEEATCNSVETVSKAAVESVSTPIAIVSTQHEEVPVNVGENTLTKQDEVAVDVQDKVEPPKDVPVTVSTSESTSILTSDVVLIDKEHESAEADVEEEPAVAQTIVEPAVKEVSSTSLAEAVVDKCQANPLILEERENLEAKSQDQNELSEIARVESTNSTSVVATIVPVEELSIAESTLSQEEVEAVIASIPSVAEGEAVLDPIVEVASQTKNELEDTVKDNSMLHTGVDVAQPKSPWTPSFQVTTVGRDVSLEQRTEPGTTEPAVDSTAESRTETVEPEEQHSIDKVPAIGLVTADGEKVLRDVEQPLVSSPQLVNDRLLLVEPEGREPSQAPVEELSYSVHPQTSLRPDNVELAVDGQEPSARPWTPSYSVHSQGSSLSTPAHLAEESVPQNQESFVDNEDEAAELEEMKFADNEDAPAIASSAHLDQQAQSQEVFFKAHKEQEAPVGVTSPLTADMENQHLSGPKASSAQTAFESVHPEVSNLFEAAATNLEQDNHVHAPKGEDDINSNLVEAVASVENTEVPGLGLDANKEVSASFISASEQISEGLSPHVEESPVSPLATLYPVIQGSPARERPNFLDKAVANTESDVTRTEAPVVVEPPSALSKNVVEIEVPGVEVAEAEIATKAKEVLHEALMVKQTSVVPTQLISGELTKEFPGTAVSIPESLADCTNQELRTFSQPVVAQEMSSTDQAELNELIPLDPLAQHTNDGRHDTVSQKVSLDNKLDEDTESVAIDNVKTAMNTAVYSDGEAFPFTEQNVAEQSKKSSALSLTASGENTSTGGSSTSSDIISPATGRSRLESTASSRFFPGAWFSPSKTVDESRPFFEIVQGEFTPKKHAVARDPSIDEGPSVVEQSTVTQGETNKVPQPASKEQKSRWCVIM